MSVNVNLKGNCTPQLNKTYNFIAIGLYLCDFEYTDGQINTIHKHFSRILENVKKVKHKMQLVKIFLCIQTEKLRAVYGKLFSNRPLYKKILI